MMSLLDEIAGKLLSMPDAERRATINLARKANAGYLITPNPGPQTDAYFSPADTLYYGGSAGGGKSFLLLMLAVNEHRVSRLFRRQFKDIDGEGGLAPTLAAALGTSDGYNSQKHVWKLQHRDAAIEFGAFETAKEAEAYQGRAADFFGFDEAVQFQEPIVRFITAWNRSAIKGQRCRTVLASNPPLTPEGLWIFDWFAPWLDTSHPNPAKAGELRWFAQVDGHEIEVDRDYRSVIIDANGTEMEVRPKSRTFIPASLSDNPDLLDSGYASQLAALPKHLQDALAAGRFTSTLEDAERQVIPTAWILAAQERWQVNKWKLESEPMTALGVDVASGGVDRMVCVPLHGVVFDRHREKPGSEVRSGNDKMAFVMQVARDDPQFNVDNNGYGDDLCTALESNHFKVIRLKGGAGSNAKARDGRDFENMRAQLIWRFREALCPDTGDNICLPPGRDILMEMTAFREQPREDMRKVIRIESNDDIKKRIGRSPDIAWGYFFGWYPTDVMREVQRERTLAARNRRRSSTGTHKINRQYATRIG